MATSAQSPSPHRSEDGWDGLVRRVAAGDLDALAVVYDRLAPALYRVAGGRSRSPEDTEEVVLGICLQIWRSAPGFELEGISAEHWVVRAVDIALGGTAPP